MSNQIKVGQFVQDGGLVNLPLGFIPDYIEFANRDLTNTVFTKWWKLMETNDISGSQEGIAIADGGGTTDLADAGGITAYDTGAQIPTITTWTKAVGDAATARTATKAGTYVKPSVANEGDRGSVFECVTAGTSDSTEPTWPVVDGENVTDGTTVWKKVNVNLQRGGYQGVVIAGAIQTDGQLMYYFALMADQAVVHGDVDGWPGGVDPDA